jgi:hypothetical protein
MRYKADIMDYLPEYYHDKKEIRQIMDTQNIELTALGDAIERVLANQYVASLDIWGIERYEKILAIMPDIYNETVELRRRRIASILMTKPPFSHGFFIQYYNNILGVGEWEEIIYLDDCSYELFLNYAVRAFENEISNFLEKTLPLHVNYTVHLRQTDLLQCNMAAMVVSTGSVTTKMVR